MPLRLLLMIQVVRLLDILGCSHVVLVLDLEQVELHRRKYEQLIRSTKPSARKDAHVCPTNRFYNAATY